MPLIDRPTISSNGAIVSTGVRTLNVAVVARPAYRLQVIQIKEQLKIAFVRFNMMHHCTARVIPVRLQMRITAAVLAFVFVPCQCLTL
jgi:hypothetical protein